jgi:protein TonB
MHALRFPLAAGSGFVIALTIFTLLWTFVNKPLEFRPATKVDPLNFTRQRVDTPVEPKRVEKVVRQRPAIVPTNPGFHGDPTGVTATPYEPFKPIVERGGGGGGPSQMGQDREAVPIVRVPPEYPPTAHNVEGWVKVQFSITAAGTVRDALIIDADPKGVFDAAALKAIARWRYNPRVEGGVAVERVGLETLIRFELQ